MTFQNSDFEAVATFNKRGWSRYAEKMVSTFIIEPSYPKGKPDELEGVVIDRSLGQPI